MRPEPPSVNDLQNLASEICAGSDDCWTPVRSGFALPRFPRDRAMQRESGRGLYMFLP